MNSESWAVHVYENGKHIGRLSPDGTVQRLNIYAGMFSQKDAITIADDMTSRTDGVLANITAKAKPFSK